jgi:hypothetical protein
MYEIYATFIKQMKAENPQLNVSEVSFLRGKAGKNSFEKHNSSGRSNVSNAAVDYRFFEKHEYHAFTPGQKNTLRIKHLKHGHVGKDLPNQEEEAWRQLKGKPFSFHNAPGICWPCGRRKQVRP